MTYSGTIALVIGVGILYTAILLLFSIGLRISIQRLFGKKLKDLTCFWIVFFGLTALTAVCNYFFPGPNLR